MAAKDNVNAGDVVLREEPVVACLLPKLFGSNCLHCFTRYNRSQKNISKSMFPIYRLEIPVCCPSCSGVAFCSDECMTAAWNSYHKYECTFSDLLVGKWNLVIIK